MKGLVKYAGGEGNVEIRDVPEPSPGPGQVKIEVKAAGICGSDVHLLKGDIAIPIRPPVVIGHEFSGVILQLGSGVSGWRVGDRVTVEPGLDTCGQCLYCQTGHSYLCKERRPLGFHYNGGFAKYVIAPAQNVYRLPDNVDFIGGALGEPVAVVTHGVIEISRVLPGDNVLVSGVGAIGLLAAQVARCYGARVVISGTSADENRFRVAKSLGFEELVNVEKTDLKNHVQEITRGRGMDVILECSGAPEAARTGLEVIRKLGVYTQIGLFNRPFELNFEVIAYKELFVRGAMSHGWNSWKLALTLLEKGMVKSRPLVSHIYPLTEWQEAFAKFTGKEGMKVVLTPVGE